MEQRWVMLPDHREILCAPCFGSNGEVRTNGEESKANGECTCVDENGAPHACCVGAMNEILPKQFRKRP